VASLASPFNKPEISARGTYSRSIGPNLDTCAKNPELHRENLVAALA
jgi:hypothetical protein